MEQKKYNPQNDPGTWQTGRTEPPKHYRGVIALLLVLVILLSGIATALSFLNFKLYFQLNTQETTPQVSFSRGVEIPSGGNHEEDTLIPGLGISGTVIPSVYQRYYQLPNGFYITQVYSGGQAAQKGLLAGDIITAVNGYSITDSDDIASLMEKLKYGQELALNLYRNGTELSASLIWED